MLYIDVLTTGMTALEISLEDLIMVLDQLLPVDTHIARKVLTKES